MTTHDIKCLPAQFAVLETQEKTFEFRKNDRNYQVGDLLIIREWLLSEQRYTGKRVMRIVSHMLTEGFGLPDGYAVLSLWTPEQLPEKVITIPTSADEAEAMEKMGFAWLREHAPQRLTPEGLARPIPAKATMATAVKALEWSESLTPDGTTSFEDYCTANVSLGAYRIEWKSWKPGSGFAIHFNGDFVACEYSLDAAKASAQAHRERHILSALCEPSKGGTLQNALAMTGCENEEDLIDMANIGRSLMSKIDFYVEEPSLLEGWSPAEDPAEIVGDLYNRLEESLACHRQAMAEAKAATAIIEQIEALFPNWRAYRDLVDCVDSTLPMIAPHGFRWLDRPITVTGGDYRYDGQLLLSFPKEPGGTVRYIVRDGNNRLFIHNAQQCGLEE